MVETVDAREEGWEEVGFGGTEPDTRDMGSEGGKFAAWGMVGWRARETGTVILSC